MRAKLLARMTTGGGQPTSNKRKKLNEKAEKRNRQTSSDDDSGDDSGDDSDNDDDSAGGGIGLNARMFEWLMFYEVGNNTIHFPGNSSDSIILHQYVCLLTTTM